MIDSLNAIYNDWKERYGLKNEPNFSQHTDADCAAAFKAGFEAAAMTLDKPSDGARADLLRTMFNIWWASDTHRLKYTADHPARLAAEEAFTAAHSQRRITLKHWILMVTTAYEQGVGKGHQAYHQKTEISCPYGDEECIYAWCYGYQEGKEQAKRVNWNDAGRLLTAAAEASLHGLLLGTTNWAAYVLKRMQEPK